MDVSKFQSAIRTAAAGHALSEAEFVSEIENAIRLTLEKAVEEENLEVLSKWQKIPCAGEYPSAYEMMEYLCEELCRSMLPENG